MKVQFTHLLLLFVIVFTLGFVANHVIFEGELPVDFPMLVGASAITLLAYFNQKVAKIRNILMVLIIVGAGVWFWLFLQGLG